MSSLFFLINISVLKLFLNFESTNPTPPHYLSIIDERYDVTRSNFKSTNHNSMLLIKIWMDQSDGSHQVEANVAKGTYKTTYKYIFLHFIQKSYVWGIVFVFSTYSPQRMYFLSFSASYISQQTSSMVLQID